MSWRGALHAESRMLHNTPAAQGAPNGYGRLYMSIAPVPRSAGDQPPTFESLERLPYLQVRRQGCGHRTAALVLSWAQRKRDNHRERDGHSSVAPKELGCTD